MVLPIISYGHSILRQKCTDIAPAYPGLETLLDDMWETMYAANGCGLAAPQIDRPVRIFIVDSKQSYDDMDAADREEYFTSDTGIQETFINAQIVERSQKIWMEDEGCLSIPFVVEEVERPWSITIEYADRHFHRQRKTFGGVTARMIQHEFDHTEGILYIDYLKPLKRMLLENKLKKVAQGKVQAKYSMKFP